MQAANPYTTNRIQEQLTTRLPLVWFSLAFLAGIVCASLVSLHIFTWIALIVASIILIILSRILRPLIPPTSHFSLFTPLFSPFTFILLLAFFLGAARYQISVPRFNAFHIAFYNDREYDVLVTGTVIEPPDYRDNYTNLRLKVSSVDTGDTDLPASELLLVRASNNQVFHYGEILRVRGKLKTPPENEDFSYRDYLAAQHIHSYMSSVEVTTLPGRGGNPFSRALYAFKEKALTNIYRMFPDPESSL